MQFICQLCGYIYDEEKESMPFEDLPDDWVCPLCQAPKSLFTPQKAPAITNAAATPGTQAEANVGTIGANSTPRSSTPPVTRDADGDVLARLSAGQLAALCGNLARGCEKQARMREAELFNQLATSFGQHIEPVDDASVDALATLLLEDTARYANARARASEAGDRGTLRIITWGERITNMLKYLTDRYVAEGEAFLANTNIWVCTVCGFIYVGDEAPELCPVCKVPAWKFELVKAPAASAASAASTERRA